MKFRELLQMREEDKVFVPVVTLVSSADESAILLDCGEGGSFLVCEGNRGEETTSSTIREVRRLLSDEFKDVRPIIFIDVRVGQESSSLEIRHNNTINDHLIRPAVNNIKMTSIQFDEVSDDREELITSVADQSRGVHAFRFTIAKNLFADKPKRSTALKIFEETIIFLHLAMKGDL